MMLFPGIVKIVPTPMLSCSPDKKSSKALKIEVKFRQIPRMSRHFSESPQFLDMTSFSRIAEFVPPPVTSCVFLIKKHRKPWFVNRQNSLNMTSFPKIAGFVPLPVTSCFPDTKSQKRSYNLIENINFDESLECDVISNNSENFRRELRELNGEQGYFSRFEF